MADTTVEETIYERVSRYISTLKDTQRMVEPHIYKPFPWQREWLNDRHQNRLLVGSRQIGKSMTIAWEKLLWGLEEPHTKILFIAPSQGQSINILQYVKHFSRFIPKGEHDSSMKIDLWNGSLFMALPNSLSNIRGHSGHVVLDEFAHFPNDSEIKTVTNPMTSRGFRTDELSTPFGARGEFYNDYLDSFDHNEPSNGKMWSRHVVPWWKSPLHDIQSLIRDRIRLGEEIFNQEYCCEFLSESGRVFGYDFLLAHSRNYPYNGDAEMPWKPDVMVYRGCDYGFVMDRSIVIDIYRPKPDAPFQIGAKYVFNHIKPSEQLDFLEKYDDNVVLTAFDATGPGRPLVEDLKSRGVNVLPIQFSNPMKDMLINNLRNGLANGDIVLPANDHHLLSELHSITREITDKGHVRYEGEKRGKHHADEAWALMMAYYAVRAKPFSDDDFGGIILGESIVI